MDEEFSLKARIHYDDPRYPMLIIEVDGNTIGYDIDKETGKVGKQVCTCNAWNESECCCGVWYDN